MAGMIGPHEGQEMALMRAGQKHVALFSQQLFDQEEAYEDLLREWEYGEIAWEDESQEIPVSHWIIYRNTHEAEAEELFARLNDIKHVNEHNERRIGEILGYSPDDIQAWIDHLFAIGAMQNNIHQWGVI